MRSTAAGWWLNCPSCKLKLQACIFLRHRKLQNWGCCVLGQFSTHWATKLLFWGGWGGEEDEEKEVSQSAIPNWYWESQLDFSLWSENSHLLRLFDLFIFFCFKTTIWGTKRSKSGSFALSFCFIHVQYKHCLYRPGILVAQKMWNCFLYSECIAVTFISIIDLIK